MSAEQRYFSQIVMPQIGTLGQQKIQAARVLVIGAGGLGCPVLSYLAGLGVGHIGIMDNDTVSLQNLHRQVLYTEADIGLLKAVIAGERLSQQNSTATTQIYTYLLDAANAADTIKEYDVVIDCCDNVATRYIIDDCCKKLQIPFVYGAVKHMEGQVSVFNYKGGRCYRDLYADENAAAFEDDCSVAGIAGFVTGTIGSLQVSEAMKIIVENENILSGVVLSIDLEQQVFRKFKIRSCS
jgi:sulfur-carrier protein adenylyltransferase/sulfurtransferase